MGGKFADDPPIEAYENDGRVVHLPAKRIAPSQDFPVTWVSDAVLQLDAKPVIKGLIEYGSFVVVYGPSGSGKSFFTADMAQHIATGAAWRGRKVTQGLIVYVAAEAGASILKRFVAWRDKVLGETAGRVPIAVITRAANLVGGTDFEKLAAQISALQVECGLPVSVVVFDTLSRSMAGGDENKSEDMTEVISAADKLRDQFNCATIFVHHSGKDVERGARGHSSLFAAADLVLQVNERVATVAKIRDGVSGDTFPFDLERVVIGQDADGDDVTTCLLIASDAPKKQPARIPMGKNQKIAWPALLAYAQEEGDRSPGTSIIPRGVLVVSMKSAIEAIVPKFGADDPTYRVREKVREAIMGLQAAKFVGVHDDLVWLLA